MPEQLAAWLVDECNKRNLSWSEASRRAGVSHNTISQIVNGVPAGPKRLVALAEYFNAPQEWVFQLAGLLPEPRTDGNIDPLVQRYVDELLSIWHELKDTDENAAQRLMGITIMQAEMLLAAIRANCADELERRTQEDRTIVPA